MRYISSYVWKTNNLKICYGNRLKTAMSHLASVLNSLGLVPKRKKGFIGPLQASVDPFRDSRRKIFILGFAVPLHTIFDLGK
jgi:hypothetical protein